MKPVLLLLLAGGITALAQPVAVIPPGTNSSTFATTVVSPRTIRVSVSQQPMQTFTAVLGSKLPGVYGYSMTACLPFNEAAFSLSGLNVQQMIEGRGIAVMSYQVALQTANLARRQSKQYKIYSTTSELGYAVTVAMPLLGVGSLIAKVAAPVVAHYAEQAKDNLAAQLPDPGLLAGKFLDDTMIALTPGTCSNKLFLGSQSDLKAFEATLEVN